MSEAEVENLSPPVIQARSEDPWNRLFVDLEAIESNYGHIRSKLPGGAVLYAVLKSDAYGHGIAEVSRVLYDAGCRRFAVESPQEGIRLRNEGIKGEILLMNPIPAWMAELSVRHDLSVSVIHISILEHLEEAAALMGRTARVHINANIGLNRLGASPKKITAIARKATEMSHIELAGLFGQPRDSASAEDSYRRLMEIASTLRGKGLDPGRVHFSNSTTFIRHPEYACEGVRIGILLYGVMPPEQYREGFDLGELRPAMSLETEIVQVRELPKGSRIGYRSKQRTHRDLVIGTIPMGYNHGLSRKMLGRAHTLVKGREAPFVGAISMNSATIDVTGSGDVGIGDTVTIVGRQGGEEIGINELAEQAETIAAELMMGFGRSIPCIYSTKERDPARQVTFARRRAEDIRIGFYQNSSELPEYATVYELIRFIRRNLRPYEDSEDTIATAVDYALSYIPEGKGFILLATIEERVVGAVVCVQMHRIAIVPQNLIVYFCVDEDFRNIGLGRRLVTEAVECCEGEVKLHVEKGNPAAEFCRKLGFRDDHLEMRYRKEGR